MIRAHTNAFTCFPSNNTLWGSLEEPNIINTNEFEDLFSKATLQPKKKPLSDTFEKKAKTKKVRYIHSLVLGLALIFVSSCFFPDVFAVEGHLDGLVSRLQPPEGVVSVLSYLALFGTELFGRCHVQ